MTWLVINTDKAVAFNIEELRRKTEKQGYHKSHYFAAESAAFADAIIYLVNGLIEKMMVHPASMQTCCSLSFNVPF
jgi:hypothetical protein